MKKLLFILGILLTVNSMSFSQTASMGELKKKFALLLLNDLTIATDGHILKIIEPDGFAGIQLPAYSTFDLINLQVKNLLEEEKPYKLKIYRAWQNDLGPIKYILREERYGFLFLIMYYQYKESAMDQSIVIVWSWKMIKALATLKTFMLKDNEFENKF